MGAALDQMEALGEDALMERIGGGESQAEIARSIGVSPASLNGWIHANDERSARARVAMSLSAETWLDRGLEALQSAEPEAAEIARARAIEQHCARRAAIRDPKRYGDKIQAEHSGPDGGPMKFEEIRRTVVDPVLDTTASVQAQKSRD